MKRSEINRIMADAMAFMNEYRFALPPFAHWKPEDWQAVGDEATGILRGQLGWDITDFGAGRFEDLGLFLFTIRNGVVNQAGPTAKSYAEKIMIVREQQVTPTHYHWQKMEDIINRGGGALVVQLWNVGPSDELADTSVEVECDGVKRTVEAGGTVTLEPGQSITLPPKLWHKFWGQADRGWVLVGEVSKVNDDNADNHFHEPIGRFPDIEEDEPPTHLLVGDYAKYCSHLG